MSSPEVFGRGQPTISQTVPFPNPDSSSTPHGSRSALDLRGAGETYAVIGARPIPGAQVLEASQTSNSPGTDDLPFSVGSPLQSFKPTRSPRAAQAGRVNSAYRRSRRRTVSEGGGAVGLTTNRKIKHPASFKLQTETVILATVTGGDAAAAPKKPAPKRERSLSESAATDPTLELDFADLFEGDGPDRELPDFSDSE